MSPREDLTKSVCCIPYNMTAFLSGLSAFLDLSRGSTSLSTHQFGPDQTSPHGTLSSPLLHAVSSAWNTFFRPTDPADSSPSFTTDLAWQVVFLLHHCQSYIPPTNGMTWCLQSASEAWREEEEVGAGIVETRLAMTDGSAGTWEFFKIWHFGIYLKFSILRHLLKWLLLGCHSQETSKSLKAGAGSYSFWQPQHLTPSQWYLAIP